MRVPISWLLLAFFLSLWPLRAVYAHEGDLKSGATDICNILLNVKKTQMDEYADWNKADKARRAGEAVIEIGAYTRLLKTTQKGTANPLSIAVLPAGKYNKDLETRLINLGYLGVAIRDPNEVEVRERTDFILASQFIRWMMPTYKTDEEWILSMTGKSRTQVRKKLQLSANVPKRIVNELTLGEYDRWQRELFVPYVLSKPGGTMAWPPVETFIEWYGGFLYPEESHLPLDQRRVRDHFGVFFHGENGQLIGGTINFVDYGTRNADGSLKPEGTPKEEFVTRIGGAAWSPDAYKLGLAVRGIQVVLDESRRLNVPFISYGHDMNFYGIDTDAGLSQSKAIAGMAASTPAVGDYELLKIFPENLGQLDIDDSGFLIFGIAGTGIARLSAYEGIIGTRVDGVSHDARILAHQRFAVGYQIFAAPQAENAKLPVNLKTETGERKHIRINRE